jgi:hypothetical protein
MSDWRNWGGERKGAFEEKLKPGELRDKLREYQKAFGKDFGIRELLMLEDIRSKVLIAEAINDAPEFLMDQVGIMRNTLGISTISKALDDMAGALWQVAENT